eukprot:Awhi_evm1s15750
MSSTTTTKNEPPKKKSFVTTLVAGGCAGAADASICHPLDTIKTRLQLQKTVGRSRGIIATTSNIIKVEGYFALYKGLSAVFTGIVPKMAIRYSSFEKFKEMCRNYNGDGSISIGQTMLSGTAAGVIEAVAVVTPLEVLKIRLQAQTHSMSEPNSPIRKYRNLPHAFTCIVREEGPQALYKGVVPTVLRQASNQAVNFTVYDTVKKKIIEYNGTSEIPLYQSLMLGGFSGGIAPCCNAPLDTVKTRLQKQKTVPGQKPKYDGVIGCMRVMYREEGVRSFYKGLLPRLMRISPGQAITFMTYEFVSKKMTAVPALASA